jgi:hypothetical protein
MVERPGVGRLIGPGRAVERAWVRRPLAGFGRAVETRQRGSEDCGESVGRGQAVERQGRAERRSGPGGPRGLAGAGSWRPAGKPQSPVMAALDSHRQRSGKTGGSGRSSLICS